MPVSRHICAEIGNALGSNNLYRCVMAEVTSSNTVGYSKLNLATGYTCLTSAFFTPGQDVTVIDAMEVVGGIDADNLSTLDSTGNVVDQYFWFNAFGQWPAMWALDGQGATEATGITFDQMEGFLFYSNASEAKLKHWGEVLEADVEDIALNTGYTTLGNPYNKALPLENLVPVGAMDADNISTLDSTGNVVDQYFWFNAFGQWPAMWALDGQGATEATGVTLNPNVAFLFYSNASGATLDVDAP